MQWSRLINITLITAIFSLVSACGGGSGNNPVIPPGTKMSQTLTFEKTIPSTLKVDLSFTNKAVGKGTGNISYASSDPLSATVDDTGLVQVLDIGKVTITATIAEDTQYHAASASYSFTGLEMRCEPVPGTLMFDRDKIALKTGEVFINEVSRYLIDSLAFSSSNPEVASVSHDGTVTALSSGSSVITAKAQYDHCGATSTLSYTVEVTDTSADEISLTAWVGAEDTLFTLPAAASGLEFYRSSAAECDFTHYASCANGQMDIVSGTQLTDTTTQLARSGFYLFKNSQSQAPVTLHKASHPALGRVQLLNLNNQLWSFHYDSDSRATETWTSLDGLRWTPVTSQQNFHYRAGQKIAVHNGKFWLVGGYLNDGVYPSNDIWSSADGINWNLAASVEGFTRSHHQLVSFNNKLWLIGGDYVDFYIAGLDNTRFFNDVWSSNDGVTWIRETEHAGFSARSGHQVIAFNNQLWLFGGYDKEGRFNDIWSSSDGVTWTEQTAHSSLSNRAGFQLAVHAAKLWLIAGSERSGNKRDIWSSGDGLTWTQETAQAALTERNEYQLVNFNNGLLLAGGLTAQIARSDIWFSTNGIDWRQGLIGSFHLGE